MKRKLLFMIILLVLNYGCKKEIIYIDTLPQLKIIVKDSNGNFVSNAQVSLYNTENDLLNRTNQISQLETNLNGWTLFINLEEKIYFFRAEKGNLSNAFTISYFSDPLKINEIRIIQVHIY